MKLFCQGKAWRGRDWTLDFIPGQGPREGGLCGSWVEAREGPGCWGWRWSMTKAGADLTLALALTQGVASSLGWQKVQWIHQKTQKLFPMLLLTAAGRVASLLDFCYLIYTTRFGQDSFSCLFQQQCCVTLRNSRQVIENRHVQIKPPRYNH